MADAKKLLEGLELPEETQTKIIEKLNPVFSDYDSKLADATQRESEANNKLQEAITTRQKAKDELRELKQKFVDGDFDGKKEMQALIISKENEVASLTQKTTELESKFTTQTQELETIRTETKAQLKEHFSDEEWEKVKDWTIPQIRTAAEMKSEKEIVPGDKTKRIPTYRTGKIEKTSEEKIESLYGKK